MAAPALARSLMMAVGVWTLALAGCLEEAGNGGEWPYGDDVADDGEPPGQYTVVSISGEVDALNATAPAAWCTTERTATIEPAQQRVWASQQVINQPLTDGSLLVVSDVRQRAAGGAAACDLPIEAHGSLNGSLARQFLWSMGEDVRFERGPHGLTVDGRLLVRLGRVDLPAGPGGADVVTAVNLGEWPLSKLQTVPYSWTECCPPEPPAPTPDPPVPPPPPALPPTYILLTIDGNVTRSPPPPPPNGPQPHCGRTGHPFVRVDFANETMHLVGSELRGHDFDRTRTKVVVYDRIDLAQNACGSRPALWGAEESFQWSYPVPGGAFTAGIGRVLYRLDNQTVDYLAVDSDRLRPGESFAREVAFESNGTRWSMTLTFTAHGPWLSQDVQEWPRELDVPRVGKGASWHIDMPS